VTAAPSKLDPDAISNGLARDTGTWHAPVVRDQLDSTNDELRRMADDLGALNGGWLLALADAQTHGRGRMGHGWFSPPGAAIHLSVGASLRLSAPLWPRASLVVGVAVAEAIAEQTGVDVRLKWPNDLLVRHEGAWRKAGGILCERYDRSGSGSASNGAGAPAPLWIAGIGIDTSIARGDFPALLREHVASLSWIVDAPDRHNLAVATATAVRRSVERWQQRGGQLDTARLRERMVFIGNVVSLDHGDGKAAETVQLLDIADNGGLLVRRGATDVVVQPLQIVAAETQPPWQAPPRLAREPA
jgi:BirA family transcriptional regulator, biotin operon repressor / biotin---[acetyl-CoA-carboxylase] ligase